MATRGGAAVKRIALEIAGWFLVLVGIAALFLPGPGLLALFAGLAILSQQYEWAARRVEPVKKAALKTARDGVQSWPRIIGSCLGCLILIGLGIYWGIGPSAPSWWPVRDSWWLAGGWFTGGTLIFSGLVAFAMIVWSYVNFRGKPEPA